MKKTDNPVDGVFINGNNNEVNVINITNIYNEPPHKQDDTTIWEFIAFVVSVLTVSPCNPELLADYIRLHISIAIGR